MIVIRPPSSIFVRIYGGLLIVISTVAICAYLILQVLNEQRAADYREKMATGFFHLISLGVARQPSGPARDAWLQEAGQLMNNELSLVKNVPALNFSSDELDSLSAGRVVLRLDVPHNAADIYVRVPGEKEVYLKARMSKVSEQQAKAMAVFLLDDLEQFRGQEAKRLKELQPYFAFPLSMVPLESVGLEPDQRARIKRNEVVIALKEGAGTRNSSIRIIAPAMYPGQVLVMGPMYLFEWMPVKLLLIVCAVSLGIITVAAYFIIHPLEKKIKTVEQAVRHIRAGDLGARANVDGRDEVSQLAFAFNSMAEHIQRLIDSQRELTRAVSHELRTPVARIRFGMEMMADTEELEARLEQLTELDHDIDELNKLIDEILTYAKLEQGIPVLNFETVDLGSLLARVAKETSALGLPARVEYRVLSDAAEVEAEARYLHRVLQNLAGNAGRYAQSRILLTAWVEDGWAHVAVEDDGPGIPEKDRERIFQPFTRLDDSRTRASGGYGLGLSIVSRIAFWFGGQITVGQSDTLGGARFEMSWPEVQKRRNKLPRN
ncbi:histidine kinase [Fluviicoccus keumensis]|uniref:histidine kinase n=1 Tax=Fluviicoccus keumensis TaxID=1435465 RepID=A0A4Q7ZC11_9GAMM|nr:ATP-binding protein [Fluviicoccus keumensis]RZU47495.1 histidine kinase [Fluviicoccus keumensis]